MEQKIEKDSLLNRWKKKDKKTMSLNSMAKAPEGALIPLSNGQQRLWFLQQLYPNNPFYNYSETTVFNGILKENILEESAQQLFKDHDILRSTYHIENGQMLQRIDRHLQIAVSRYDLSTSSINEAREHAKKIIFKDATKSFDLSTGPLVRVSLIKVSDTEHILQFTLHHITIDKWSMGILREQLARNYVSLCSHGSIARNNRTEIQYADYAYCQQGQEIDPNQIAYWKHKLSGDNPQLNLPTDYIRPMHPSFSGALNVQEFSRNLSKNLLDLSRTLETTPYVLLLSVYYVLLFRYSGQKDILIGSPISNRDEKILENLIGFFNDTVVLHTTLGSGISFADLVKEVRNTVLEAFTNKNVPFDLLVKTLKPDRSLSVNPFFQVMFVYHSAPPEPDFGSELTLSHAPFDTGVAKFDLTLYISEQDGILASTFEYATDLFKESTIKRLQEYFKLLLEGITADPYQSITTIPMQTEEEKRRLLYADKPVDKGAYSEYNAIHEIVEAISIKKPDSIALVFQEKTMTYAELNQKAEILAQFILESSDKRMGVVGLCLERSLDMIVGLFAILKSGHAYLPIDPEYPLQRIRYMLKDAGADLVLTQESLAFKFLEMDPNMLCIDALDLTKDKGIKLADVDGDDLAYIIYTSGSTGQPKGVPISHYNLINSTQGRLEFYSQNPTTFLLMSSIAFDSSKAGIFWTLCTGGTLVISEKRIEQDINRIADAIHKNKVSHTLMLPSLYKLVLEYSLLDKLKSLATVIVAGEACFTGLCKKHFETLPNVKLYNEYGPTEATVWCVAHQIKEEDLNGIIPIGKPVANSKVYLLNDEMQMVPTGAKGEICIGGPGLARMYLNRPELLDTVFVDNPFSNIVGEKLYKTGDLGKFGEDGTITFLGRTDQQVKITGHRIEVGEIEKILLENPMVEKAVVVVESLDEDSSFDLSQIQETSELISFLEKHLSEEEVGELLDSVASLTPGEKEYLLQRLE